MRKVIFWGHLMVGSVAGIVILLLSVTGAMLAFERQITAWSDRQFHSSGPLQPETWHLDGHPNVTVRSEPNAPVMVSLSRQRTIYLDGATGQRLGDATQWSRTLFARIEGVHRALGTPLRGGWGRPVVQACNLLFLGLIVSGFYLWMPKRWTSRAVRPVIWFRGGLRGRARNWNWHHVIGIWCFVPLFAIVLCGVVISYRWASDLLFQLTNSSQSATAGGKESARLAGDSSIPLGEMIRTATGTARTWKSVSFQYPEQNGADISFTVDTGTGGQPQARSTVRVSRATGRIVTVRKFSDENLGRRLRAIARFLHTGEVSGLAGQAIAAVATFGAVFLVWTGLSLSLQRAKLAVTRKDGRPVPQPELLEERTS